MTYMCGSIPNELTNEDWEKIGYRKGYADAIDEIISTRYFADKVELIDFEAYITIDDLLEYLKQLKGQKHEQ